MNKPSWATLYSFYKRGRNVFGPFIFYTTRPDLPARTTFRFIPPRRELRTETDSDDYDYIIGLRTYVYNTLYNLLRPNARILDHPRFHAAGRPHARKGILRDVLLFLS